MKSLFETTKPVINDIVLKNWAETLEAIFLEQLKEVEGANGQIGTSKVKEVFSTSQIHALNIMQKKLKNFK